MSNIIPFPNPRNNSHQESGNNKALCLAAGWQEFEPPKKFSLGDIVQYTGRCGSIAKGIIIDARFDASGTSYRIDNAYTRLWLPPERITMVKPKTSFLTNKP